MMEKFFEIYDVSFCPNRDVLLILDIKWPGICRKLRLSDASRELIRVFFLLNGASLQVDDDGKNEAILCLIMWHSETRGILYLARIIETGRESYNTARISNRKIPVRGETSCQHHHIYVTMSYPALLLSV